MQSIKTVIADGHLLVRTAVRRLLENEADIEVVGEASDGLEAIDVVDRTRPDVVVLELAMPALNGLGALQQLSRSIVKPAALVLTSRSEDRLLRQAFHYGASGYVLKQSAFHSLLQGIRAVAAGSRYLCPELTERAIEIYTQRASVIETPQETLSPREREVLQMVVEGSSSVEIARRLNISHRTVENHRASVMKKLGLRNHMDLVAYAMREGILLYEPFDE